MAIIRCCVPLCANKISKRHRFPNPKKNIENFRKWISLFPKSVFKDYTDLQIYNNLRICATHFGSNCYSIGLSKLNYDACPTAFMPGTVFFLFFFIIN